MRQYGVCSMHVSDKNCKKLSTVGAALERAKRMSWCYWGEQSRWLVYEVIYKSRESCWPGNLFKMLDAAEEKDFEKKQ